VGPSTHVVLISGQQLITAVTHCGCITRSLSGSLYANPPLDGEGGVPVGPLTLGGGGGGGRG